MHGNPLSLLASANRQAGKWQIDPGLSFTLSVPVLFFRLHRKAGVARQVLIAACTETRAENAVQESQQTLARGFLKKGLVPTRSIQNGQEGALPVQQLKLHVALNA